MHDNLRRATIGFALFVIICLVGTFALLTVFSQFRFGSEETYRAEFTDVSGLADGSVPLVVGTHALAEEAVHFSRLALAVVDEQHRFGVSHREAIRMLRE